MQFLYPSFLFVLGLIGIPILIHLFNFRRYKKFEFSDIRFLKQLTEQNKKQQTIKNWIVLACRILAISFLVFAFAQPFLPDKGHSKSFSSKLISVFIDNSFSMTSVGKEGPLFDIAKSKAKKIAEAYKETDQFQLLTNDFEGKHQRWLSKKDFLQMVDEISISSKHKKLSEIYIRQNQLFSSDPLAQKSSFWISDFQENMFDLNRIKVDSSIQVSLVHLTGVIEQNVWIDSAWLKEPFIRTGNLNQLSVKIKNATEADLENQALVLKIDGVQKAIQNYSCRSHSEVGVQVNFSINDTNWHEAELSITDYPVTFDDTYFLSLKAIDKLEVLVLTNTEQPDPFKKVFDLEKIYQEKIQSFDQINYKTFPDQSLIILNEPKEITSGLSLELTKYISNGGVVMFIPSATPKDLAGINSFLSTVAGIQMTQFQKKSLKVAQIDIKDQLFDKVFSKIPDQANLPEVFEFWQLGVSLSSLSKNIIQLNNDFPFIVHSSYKAGSVFVAASSFQKSATNFTQHALYVPVLLRLPLLAKISFPLSITLGKQDKFQFENTENQKMIRLKHHAEDYLFEANSTGGKWDLILNDQIKTAGVFSLMNQETEMSKIAFNYNRTESNPKMGSIDKIKDYLNADALEDDLSFFSKKLVLDENGVPLWRYALILALVFLLLELLFLRLLK